MWSEGYETEMDEEIRIDIYLKALIQRWWLIVLGAAVPGLIALLVSQFLIQPVYEATAGMLIAQTRSEVTFDPRFQTVDLSQLGSTAALSQQARREALVALVKNGAIAQVVSQAIAGSMDEEDLHPAVLLDHIKAELAESAAGSKLGNDLLLITARDRNPARAAELANQWAAAYEQNINQLFRDQGGAYTQILNQIDEAWETYNTAQNRLVQYLAENRLQELQLEVADQEKRIELVSNNREATLRQHYSDRRTLVGLLEDARLLQKHVEVSGESGTASNSLAILLLKAQVMNRSTPLSEGEGFATRDLLLQLNLGENSGGTSTQDQQKDIETMVSVLEPRIAGLDSDIQAILAAPLPVGLVQMQAELSRSRAELETETATHNELVRARDQAWDTYSALQVRADELNIETGLEDVQVRFASPALIPSRPVSPHVWLNVLEAALFGFLVSVIVVLTTEMLRRHSNGA